MKGLHLFGGRRTSACVPLTARKDSLHDPIEGLDSPGARAYQACSAVPENPAVAMITFENPARSISVLYFRLPLLLSVFTIGGVRVRRRQGLVTGHVFCARDHRTGTGPIAPSGFSRARWRACFAEPGERFLPCPGKEYL